MAEVTNLNVVQKIQAGLRMRGRVANQSADWILPVYIGNDEDNPIAVHPHVQPFMSRPVSYTINTTDNKGSFTTTTTTQTLVTKTQTGTTDGVTVHTVMAGKTFYLAGLTMQVSSASGAEMTLKDGGTGGTIKFLTLGTTTVPVTIASTCPIASFTTDVFFNSGGGAVGERITIWGWEE